MLEIKNLTVSINKKEILKDFSLNIKSGQIVALMGPNGIGKSTICKVIMGDSNYKVESGSTLYSALAEMKIFSPVFLQMVEVSEKSASLDDGMFRIAKYFDEVCLLFGLPGQSVESMQNDINIGLEYFERVCINIMEKNSKQILPDDRVKQLFMDNIYKEYIGNDRVDILINNTDFGIG